LLFCLLTSFHFAGKWFTEVGVVEWWCLHRRHMSTFWLIRWCFLNEMDIWCSYCCLTTRDILRKRSTYLRSVLNTSCVFDFAVSHNQLMFVHRSEETMSFYIGWLVGFMVFNAIFNKISVISWRSVLLVAETGGPRENHRHAASHWQTLSLCTPRPERESNPQHQWW
jgi:hypothetical protein